MSRAQDLVRLMRSIRVSAPAALDDVIKFELYHVVDEFFKDSDAWRQTIPVTLDPDMDPQEYVLVPDYGTANRLKKVTNAAGTPNTRATMPTIGVLKLAYVPDQAEDLSVEVSVTISEPLDDNGFPDMPDEMLSKYWAAFVDGTLARLYAQPAKPYSSPAMAVVRQRMFSRVLSMAKVEAEHQNVYGAQNWRFPRFA